MHIVPSSKDFRDKMPNTLEKRTYNKYKRRQQSFVANQSEPEEIESLLKFENNQYSPGFKASLNESFVDRNTYERLPTSEPNENVLMPLSNDLQNQRLKQVDPSYVNRLYKQAKARDRRIDEQRMLKEEQERRQCSFAPQLQNSNSKKRTLQEMIEDLYPKKNEDSTEKYANIYKEKTKVVSQQQNQVFNRLYNTGRELSQKKHQKAQDLAEQEVKALFSPKVNTRSKQMVRKCKISPKEPIFVPNVDQHTFRQSNTDEYNSSQNVFDFLNEDATRRKREQEILETQLNNPKSTQQLISQNSIKVLYKKLSNDIQKALLQLSTVYGIGTENTFELNEEQFVALLYTLGLFKDIGSTEETLYEDLLRVLCMKGKQQPVFTVRNIKLLILAIQDIHQEWMSEQDKSEWEGFYHRRIQKYKLMRTKFQAPNSDALRFSCLETPINLPNDPQGLLTEEEKILYLEQESWSGIGLFKGKSLCLNEQEAQCIHKKFHSLYLNRLKKEQEIKITKVYQDMNSVTKEETFSPQINHKSKLIVNKMQEEQRRLNPIQRNEILCKSKPKKETLISFCDQIKEEQFEVQKQKTTQSNTYSKISKPINYQRINHLYQKGKQKILKGIINDLEHAAKEEEYQLSQCTFKPVIHKGLKSKENLNQTLQEDIRRKKVGGCHKKTYSEMGIQKKIMNRTQNLDDEMMDGNDTMSSEIDEVLIVEVQLGENNKKQLQITKNDHIGDVSQKFCSENGLNEEMQSKVEDILENILSTYYRKE